MSDWIGLTFIIVLVAGAFLGLKLLSKTKPRTEEEFEKGAAEGASMLSAGINAVNGMLNPSSAKGKEAIEQVKRGEHLKKRESGKGLGKSD